MPISWETITILASVAFATAGIIWRLVKIRDELKDLIYILDRKITIIETKTVNVSADHDTLVLVEQKADAAHRRLDNLKERVG